MQTGIMFIPDDANSEEVDIVCIDLTDKNNKHAYDEQHKTLNQLVCHVYGDPYTEDYTHSVTIDTDEICKAVK